MAPRWLTNSQSSTERTVMWFVRSRKCNPNQRQETTRGIMGRRRQKPLCLLAKPGRKISAINFHLRCQHFEPTWLLFTTRGCLVIGQCETKLKLSFPLRFGPTKTNYRCDCSFTLDKSKMAVE